MAASPNFLSHCHLLINFPTSQQTNKKLDASEPQCASIRPAARITGWPFQTHTKTTTARVAQEQPHQSRRRHSQSIDLSRSTPANDCWSIRYAGRTVSQPSLTVVSMTTMRKPVALAPTRAQRPPRQPRPRLPNQMLIPAFSPAACATLSMTGNWRTPS
jgi:hypothetical protein